MGIVARCMAMGWRWKIYWEWGGNGADLYILTLETLIDWTKIESNDCGGNGSVGSDGRIAVALMNPGGRSCLHDIGDAWLNVDIHSV